MKILFIFNKGSSNSSSASSSTAQSTGIITSDSISTTSTSHDQLINQQQHQTQLPQISAINDDLHNPNNFLIEQLAHLNQNKQQQQQQQQQRLLLNQFQNTLSKHQVLEHFQQQAMDPQNKYLTNARGTNNGAQMCQYVDLNSQLPLNPHLSHLNQPAQAHTAYLVQTPNGSALLIPPQATLNHNNHFLTATNNCPTSANPNQTNLNTFARGQAGSANTNNLHYGMGTMSFAANAQQSNILAANMNTNMGNSIGSPCFARSESSASTNVYQTIDAEK